MWKAISLIATSTMIGAVACFGGADEPATPSSAPPVIAPAPVPTTPRAATITGSRITIADAIGNVGQVVPVDVAIFEARTGISGYAIAVSVADPSVARITNVSLPEFGLTQVSPLPSSSVDIMAVDLPGLLEGDIDEAWLATLYIEMLKAGTTGLTLELRSIDDDDGNIVMPQLVSGTISVN